MRRTTRMESISANHTPRLNASGAASLTNSFEGWPLRRLSISSERSSIHNGRIGPDASGGLFRSSPKKDLIAKSRLWFRPSYQLSVFVWERSRRDQWIQMF